MVYENRNCKKKLFDKLVESSSTEECTENTDEVKIADENVYVCSYTTCVVLTVIALAIRIGIGVYFDYSCWYLKKILLVLSSAPAFNGIAFKQQFNELINGKSQANRDQKSDLLFLQQHN